MGIDVSHHQGDINWSSVSLSGIRFAYIKATEGDGTGLSDPIAENALDSKFAFNAAAASQVGILAGAYHYARPDLNVNASAEADWFVSKASAYIGQGFLPPALDIEGQSFNLSSAPLLRPQLLHS